MRLKATGFGLTSQHDLLRLTAPCGSKRGSLNYVVKSEDILVVFALDGKSVTILTLSKTNAVDLPPNGEVWAVVAYSTRRSIWPDDPDIAAAKEFASRYVETNREVTAL